MLVLTEVVMVAAVTVAVMVSQYHLLTPSSEVDFRQPGLTQGQEGRVRALTCHSLLDVKSAHVFQNEVGGSIG